MHSALDKPAFPARPEWVPETAFGKWFISTGIWFRYVLTIAISDLARLAGGSVLGVRRMVDIGCGQGLAFSLLREQFQPQSLIGVDVDAPQLQRAALAAAACPGAVSVKHSSVTRLELPDGSVDVVFCHQLIHHIADQHRALCELYRVLAPGGSLLMSESCAAFINTWTVRTFFRHPEGVQKSAAEFVELVRAAGFSVREDEVQTSTPWWSLPDFGLRRRLGWQRKPLEATEILIVARKPA